MAIDLTQEEEDAIYANRYRQERSLASAQTQGGGAVVDPEYLGGEQLQVPVVTQPVSTDAPIPAPVIPQARAVSPDAPISTDAPLPAQPIVQPEISISGDFKRPEAGATRPRKVEAESYEPEVKEVDLPELGGILGQQAGKIRTAGTQEVSALSRGEQDIATADALGAAEAQRVVTALSDPNSEESINRASKVAEIINQMNKDAEPTLGSKILQFIGLAISNSAGPALLKEINRHAEVEADARMKKIKMMFPGAKEMTKSNIYKEAAIASKKIKTEYLAKKNPKGAIAAAKAQKLYEKQAVDEETKAIKLIATAQAQRSKEEIERGAPRTGKRIIVSTLKSKADKAKVIYVPGRLDQGYLLGSPDEVKQTQKDLLNYSATQKLMTDYKRLLETYSFFDKAGALTGKKRSAMASSIDFIRGELVLVYKNIKELGVLQKLDEVALEKVLPVNFLNLLEFQAGTRIKDFESNFNAMVTQYLGFRGIRSDDKEMYTPRRKSEKVNDFLLRIRKRMTAKKGKK